MYIPNYEVGRGSKQACVKKKNQRGLNEFVLTIWFIQFHSNPRDIKSYSPTSGHGLMGERRMQYC